MPLLNAKPKLKPRILDGLNKMRWRFGQHKSPSYSKQSHRQDYWPKDIKALGLTNQRETTVVWDKRTGKPLAPAIVWQDRRATDWCNQLVQNNLSEKIHKKTGLRIDPYFSAGKTGLVIGKYTRLKSAC